MSDENNSPESSSSNKVNNEGKINILERLMNSYSLHQQIKVAKLQKSNLLKKRALSQREVVNTLNLNTNGLKSHTYESVEFFGRILFVILFGIFFFRDLAILISTLASYVLSVFIEGEELNINTVFFGDFEITSYIITLISSILIFIGFSLFLKEDNSTYNKIGKFLFSSNIFVLIVIIILNTMFYNNKEDYFLPYLNFFTSPISINISVAVIIIVILFFILLSIGSVVHKNFQNSVLRFEFNILSHLLRPLAILSSICFLIGCLLVVLDQEPVGPLKLIVSPEAFENVKEVQQQVDVEESDKNKEMWSCYFDKLVSDPTSAPKCFEEEDEGIASQKLNTHEIVYVSKNFDNTILTPKQFRDDSFIFKYKVDDEMIIDNYICYFYIKNSDKKEKISYYDASKNNWKIKDRDVISSNTFSVSDKYTTKQLFCDGVKEKLILEIGKSGKEVLEVYFGVDLYVSLDVSYILDIPFINLNEKQYSSRDLALTDLLSNDDNLNQLYNIQNSWTNVLNAKVVNLRQKFPILLSQSDSSILIRDFNILLSYSNNHNPIGKLLNIGFLEDNANSLKLPSYFNLIGNPEVTSDKKGIIFNVEIKDIESTELREVIIETLRVDSKATFLIDNNEFVIKIKNENFGNEVEVEEEVEEEPVTQDQEKAKESETTQNENDLDDIYSEASA